MSPGRAFAAEELRDLGDRVRGEGGFAGVGEAADEGRAVEHSLGGQALRVEDGSDDERVGSAEGARVVLLEDLAAGGVRAGLEERPEAAARPALSRGGERAGDGGWMMREVVHDEDAVASPLTSRRRRTPAKRGSDAAISSSDEAEASRERDRAESVAQVVRSREGRVKAADRLPRFQEREVRSAGVIVDVARREIRGLCPRSDTRVIGARATAREPRTRSSSQLATIGRPAERSRRPCERLPGPTGRSG